MREMWRVKGEVKYFILGFSEMLSVDRAHNGITVYSFTRPLITVR